MPWCCAPEEWGWSGYFYSGYDQQNSGYHDRAANGGWDYLPWLLNQLHQHDTNSGQRLLDYFTVHCYPQGGEGGNDISTSHRIAAQPVHPPVLGHQLCGPKLD